MLTEDLQPIIDALNVKKFAQKSEIPGSDMSDLTSAEMAFIETYQPQQSLIIYGTLAPGRSNHYKIQMIKGVWKRGTVSGKLVSKGWGAELGYNGFVPSLDHEKIKIPAHILFSNDLAFYLSMLDEFEGDGYLRILTPFILDNGVVGAGNIYAVNEEAEQS